MQVLFKFEARSLMSGAHNPKRTTYFSTAIFQQNVDVLLVLKMVIKVHDVLVVQCFVKLDFSVNLAEGKSSKKQKKTKGQTLQLNASGW